jgi:hypothetical protein
MPSLHTFLVPIAFSMNDGQDFALIPYVAERNKVGDYCEAPDRITIVAPPDRDTGRRATPDLATVSIATPAFHRKDKLSRTILGGPARAQERSISLGLEARSIRTAWRARKSSWWVSEARLAFARTSRAVASASSMRSTSTT